MKTKDKKCFLGLLLSMTILFAPLAFSVEESDMDPKAKEVLQKASKYLGDLRSFELVMDTEINIQTQGIKNNISNVQTVAIQRPSQVVIRTKEGIEDQTLVSDGIHLYRAIDSMNLYVEKDAPKSLNELSAYPFDDAPEAAKSSPQIMFLDYLFKDDPMKHLYQNADTVEYLGTEQINGKECHKIQVITEKVNWTLYIQSGEKPLIQKIIPDMAKTIEQARQQVPNMGEMKMELVIDYKDWNTSPTFTASTFRYEPPEDYKKVDNLLQAIQQQSQQSMNPPSEEEKTHPLVGKPAPPFKLKMLDGSTFDLAAQKDKNIVILDFWATWCPPCRRAMPIIDSVAEEFKDQNVILIAVNEQETKTEIEPFLKANNLTIDVALDRTGEVGNKYMARSIPQTVIIGKDGNVQAVHVGFLPTLKSQLQEELKQLIAGKDLNEARNQVADRSTVREVKNMMKTISTALESFFIDNNAYPVTHGDDRTIADAFIEIGGTRRISLTNPVTYLASVPNDPFNPENKSFRYHSDGKNWYILVSNGPDGDIDYDESKYNGESLTQLADYMYTSAKGTGDIFRISR